MSKSLQEAMVVRFETPMLYMIRDQSNPLTPDENDPKCYSNAIPWISPQDTTLHLRYCQPSVSVGCVDPFLERTPMLFLIQASRTLEARY